MRSLRDRWRYSATATRISNWRNRRTIERGRRDLPRRAADSLRSSVPVYRNRTDPSTGRPNRDARHLGRVSDESLAYARYSRLVESRAPKFHPRPDQNRQGRSR